MGATAVRPESTAPVSAEAARPGRRSIAYQPPLDGLRGVAVIAVLLFHSGHLQGGFLGVDLFFTLSGFLITSLLLAEHDATGGVSLTGFWSRRARRLLPALYLVLAATVAYAALFARPDSLSRIRGDALAALAYVANWHSIASGSNYWDRFAAPSPLEHLWSLAVEEQFYIVWPLVVLAVMAWRGRRTLLALTVALTLGSATLMAVLATGGGSPSRVYFGTDTRAASILVGAVVALVVVRPGRDAPRLGRPAALALTGLAVVAGVALALAWATVDGATSERLYQGGFLLHALGVAVLIVAVTLLPTGPLARGLGVEPLRLVGLISYGLYLWHWPLYLVLTTSRTGLSEWRLTALRLAVTVVLAVASYLLVERPIRGGALRGPVLWAAVPVTVGALVVAMVLATRLPGPVASPSLSAPPTSASPASSAAPPPATAGTAPAASPPSSAAPAAQSGLLHTLPPLAPDPPLRLRTPTADDPLRVLLFGDSYMYDAAPGMAAALEATGVVRPTPAGLWGFTITDDSWRKTVDSLLTEDRPELVVAMWARFDVPWLAEHGRAEYEARLREIIGTMVDRGAAVAIVGLAPSQTSGVDESPVDREINDVFASVTAEFPGHALYIDPDPIVAPDGVARLTIDGPGGPLRVRKNDLAHYCPDGSARFGEAVTQLLGPLAGVPTPDPAAWELGSWRTESRYDDPRGICS